MRALGHDVRLSCYYGHESRMGAWHGMTVYPGDHTRQGKFMLRVYAEDMAPTGDIDDVQVITLMDVWTWLEAGYGGQAAFDGLRLASWVPVDHDPVPPGVVKALVEFDVRPIAMSRFGEEQLAAVGLDPLYVPHGVDTDVLKPDPDAGMLMREKLSIPADAFVVGMVANNQGTSPPRKAFPQVILAFAEFRETHPDAILYLHTDMGGLGGGINLVSLVNRYGVPAEAVRTVPQAKYLTGTVHPHEMAAVYSMMDVLANPSYGEGFGIPIVEAQACGTPVIVTDWTAMPELVGAGWKVTGDRWDDNAHGSDFMCPSVAGIVGALEEAYEARGDHGLAGDAREFALWYDADYVTSEFWEPTLAALDCVREVPALVTA